MLQKSIFCFSLIQTWGGNKGLKLWSFLQPSPTPGGRQKIMKLGWKAAGGRRSGFFPFWAPCLPMSPGKFLSPWSAGRIPGSFAQECLKGHKPGRNISRPCMSGGETSKCSIAWENQRCIGSLEAFESHLCLSLSVYVGWSMHPLNLSLLIWSVGIMLLLKSLLFQGWSTNEKVCVRETDAVIDKCLCSLG